VRDKARVVWISNEYELGDFGMGGVHIKRGGYITNGKVFAESLMVERGMEWIVRAAVKRSSRARSTTRSSTAASTSWSSTSPC
jgi:sulfide:quinone oxidoreductase